MQYLKAAESLDNSSASRKKNNGGNGGMVEWRGMAERMAEWSNGRNGYIRTIYGRHTPTTPMTTTTVYGARKEWQNG